MSLLSHFLIFLVRAYQLVLSPFLGPSCRYQPTCSSYARDAIHRYGGLKGGWMAIRRISRCHPLGGYGYDPVPDVPCGHDHQKGAHQPDDANLPVACPEKTGPQAVKRQ
ncbi:putative membrane protein insertion efficiency factor [Iodidimonas nitroreducens]|uniref:Putative membrane protein insertion efficiency factor n=1 Tax=Iodidimonas nitroreducens TaxID=1236968 RepID=A0A5A7N439_9PROT|nr:putative membrane protein insertion efficiency factor [alpha proteobacterium Q-1]GER02767.1 putative membrane protein insertion efficiency factor [Iodidimonas nitroreducens]